ncbi:ChaN family lipoprotein [Aurantimonas sp. VKM B-3413]|uniref:ChaN family lipoprotein n=1 Tax=Aurantimonas sp. VKM B-3413 TaxID=2779401 RepID=UPI001E2CAAAA|nr:ChaN family lipoprotein [Aurantimonas sp. VKM B-3413]MCB8837159.1 ChaN family lipoprotein [Aurantimonas sp. VKM B-3413]
MKRADWILPTAITVLAGLGYAVADNADLVMSRLPLNTADDVRDFVPPENSDRVAMPYRGDGDDFADVRIATVKPFADAKVLADDGLEDAVERAAKAVDTATSLTTRTSVGQGAAAFLKTVAEAGDKAAKIAVGDTSEDNPKPLATRIFDAETPVWESQFFADNPLVGGVFRADGTQTDSSSLLGAATDARYLLLGEIHDNPDHHRIQADIVGDLAAKVGDMSLVFEMIPQHFSDRLSDFGKPGTDMDSLGEKLAWNERGWPDFSTYKPIFDAALSDGLPIFGGDLDGETVGAVARRGISALPADEQQRLGLTNPLPEAQRQDMAEEIRASHCGLLPDAAVSPMVDAQRARDGALAEAMIGAAGKTGRAVLIAGAGHVRNDRGVPSILHDRQPGSKSVSVQMVEVADGEGSPDDYGLSTSTPAPYDFTIFTPRADLTDDCAALRAKTLPRPE